MGDDKSGRVFTVKAGGDGSFMTTIAPGRFKVLVSAFGQESVVILRANDRDTKTDPAVYVTIGAGGRSRLELVVATGIE